MAGKPMAESTLKKTPLRQACGWSERITSLFLFLIRVTAFIINPAFLARRINNKKMSA